ncbi:uncharacterized protein Dwil_GK13271 [Drosophila willistoni]|uniref:ZAD domain-containing protein n=1 Tax=Drosophila willistoni TaxID=7260 RepID=A0A0Q9WX12_DROWI|nr:uncharacterized protein Dwil_GK13271 [Drosophila willistoni]
MAMLCRTCGQQVHALNSKHLFDEDGMEIIRNIKILTGILITSQADMPENICVNCLLDVNNAIEFRERCIQMHNHLLEQYTKDAMEHNKLEREPSIGIEDEQDTKETQIEDYNDLIYEVDEKEDEFLICSPAAQSIHEVSGEDDDDEPHMTAEDYALIYDEEVHEEECPDSAHEGVYHQVNENLHQNAKNQQSRFSVTNVVNPFGKKVILLSI